MTTALVPTKPAGPLDPVPMRRGGKYDWQAIRHDYVVMGMKREQVLQKYGASAVLFRKRCKAGDWKVMRDDIEKQVEKMTAGVPEVPEEALEAVDQQWRQRFRELEQMAVYMQRWIAAQTRQHGQIAPVELRRLASAQRDIIQMQRLLMNESTEIMGSVDRGVEAILVIVEQFVPTADMERFKDAIARIVPRDGRAATAAAA